jgi:pilus assembly protein FimV
MATIQYGLEGRGYKGEAMNKTRKISSLVWALLFAWGSANAAGLGKLTVQSALGQPLRAEIELLSVTKDDLADLTARLASAEAFRQARIDRQESLSSLRFSVDQRANGQPVIRIFSTASVADPFLDVLIELNWSSGRLIREYTILLDPPASAKPAEIVRPASAPELPRNGAAKLAGQSEPAPAVEPAKPKPVQAVPAPHTPKRYGPVKSGETLRAIAGKVKPAEVSLEQMMVGLYQANKDAFQNNNMNRLNRGRVLNVPEAEAARANTPAEAARTVRGHAEEWHAYRRKLADMAGQAAAPKVEEKAAGKIVPKEEVKPAPAPVAPKDVLKLSKGEPGGVGKPDGKTQERMHAMEEELAAKGRALQEAQDRVSQLERTVRDMQKLLEMKTQEVAKATPAPAPVAPTPAPVVKEPEPSPAPTPAPAPAEKPKPAPVVAALPAAEPSSSWISTFIGNPIYIGGIVAAVLLSALLWMMMVGSKRRQGLTKFEDSIMTGGEFKNNAVFNASAGNVASGASTEGSMLLTDFSRLGMGAIDSHEVDPIAEAEVYMAYGRDAQAEEILREALGKDPSRHEIALKLLELYASRKDTTGFETTASELYAGLGGQNTPVWQRAAEMGRSIDPQNPLYRVAAPQAAAMTAPVAAAAVAAVAQSAMAKPAKPAAVELGDLESLASMDDWGDAPKASPNENEFASSMGTDWNAPPMQAGLPPAADAGLSSMSADNLMEFESAPAFAAPARSVVQAPEPESAVEDLNLADDFDLAPELPAAPEADQTLAVEPTAKAGQTEPTEDFGLDFPVQAPAAPAGPALAVPSDEFADLDLLEEAEPATIEAAMPALDLSAIDLDLGVDDLTKTEVTPTAENVEEFVARPVIEVAADFDPFADLAESADFEPEQSLQPEPAVEAAASPTTAESGFDPELLEEVNTKLDLARAYLEMGDREGAREILQEVLGEGDPQQKAEAGKLMADAG